MHKMRFSSKEFIRYLLNIWR